MTILIQTDKNGKEIAYRKVNGKKIRMPLADAKAEQSAQAMYAGHDLDCDVLQAIVLSDWTLRELKLSSYLASIASDVMNTVCEGINDIAELVVEAQAKPAQVVMPLLLTYQSQVNVVPDYNEVSNGQRGLIQYPEFAFDVLVQIPREFEQGITELPEIPFHERILLEQAQWLHEDIAELDQRSRGLVHDYYDLVHDYEAEEVVIQAMLCEEDVSPELLLNNMQETPCQLWQAQAIQPKVVLTTLSELLNFGESVTGIRAKFLTKFLTNNRLLNYWLYGNGLTEYHVDYDLLSGEVVYTNILYKEGAIEIDLGNNLDESIQRLVAYFSGAIESGWNGLCDYDSKAEANPEFEPDKKWLDPLQTERELLDAMVLRQEKDEIEQDKHDLYNILSVLWEQGERFTVETANDVLVKRELDIFPKDLVRQIARNVLSVEQPSK